MHRTIGWMGALAAILAAAFVGIALIAQSDLPFYRGTHLPPAAVTLFLLLESSGLPGITIGAFAHATLFVLGASHILKQPKSGADGVVWPTWVGMLMLGTLSALPWIMGAGASGLRYQGTGLVLGYGALGFGAIVGLLLWLSSLDRRAKKNHTAVRNESLLLVHFAAHMAALVVLFPCLGGSP